MSERLSVTEMWTKYPDTWLLVEDIETTPQLRLVRGNVTFLAKDRYTVERQVGERKPNRYTVIFTGTLPLWDDFFPGRGSSFIETDQIQEIEMAELLTLEEMRVRYPDEWLLVVNPQLSEKKKVLAGTVTFHSKARDETYRRAAETKPGFFTLVFTGKVSADMAFAL